MKVLVTGAEGFLGRRVYELLSRLGHDAIPAVHSRSGSLQLEGALVADLSQADALEAVFPTGIDRVAHLAATLPASFGGEDAERAAEMNRRIDYNVLNFCRRRRAGAIYASGTSVYGFSKGEFLKETSACVPTGPYVAEKLWGEELGRELLEKSGLQFSSLRISAPYGPQQRKRTVINLFIERAMAGLPLFYHGTGSRQQDFTYVDDVAQSFAAALEREKSGIFNISGGTPVSMIQLAELVVRSVPDCRSEIRPSGEDDPQEGCRVNISNAKAREELGWVPVTPLASGIVQCVVARASGA